jgi:ATP/maltotriose-dependent transcriptional regulator MalT
MDAMTAVLHRDDNHRIRDRRQIGRPPPGFRDGLVSRERLVSRLQGATDAAIALVVAPAGYG